MKIETIKSYILTILVLISLFLTFALWNYQPNYDALNKDASKYLNESNIGGTEETKRTIVEPKKIIFHKDDESYGFKKPKDQQNLYNMMQKWVLDDYQSSVANGPPKDSSLVEIAFPTDLPVAIIKSLFSPSEEDTLPNWSFQRMFISFNQSKSTLDVIFLSIDNHQQVRYVVKDPNVYAFLLSHLQPQNGLVKLVKYDADGTLIYLPESKVEMTSKSFSVNSIGINLLVDALFKDPSTVSSNTAEGYYSDGIRGIKVLEDRRSMEFVHPMHSSGERINIIELLERSLASINEHKGWTDTYRLDYLDPRENLIRYRMHVDGYPVHSSSNLSIIEQELVNQELRAYKRPLFNLVNTLGSENVILPSGKEVIFYLSNNENYLESKIKDIQIGYKLTYLDRVSYTLSLDPVWYMNYDGIWIEINVDDYDDQIIGGN